MSQQPKVYCTAVAAVVVLQIAQPVPAGAATMTTAAAVAAAVAAAAVHSALHSRSAASFDLLEAASALS